MIEYNKNFDDNSIIPFFIEPQNDPGRGKVHFCCNSILNLFEEGFIPCKQEFPEVRKKNKFLTTILKVYVISHHITV